MNVDPNSFVFPRVDVPLPNGNTEWGTPGVTLRTYAIIEFTKGLLANPSIGENVSAEGVADFAIEQADVLFKKLNAAKKGGAK